VIDGFVLPSELFLLQAVRDNIRFSTPNKPSLESPLCWGGEVHTSVRILPLVLRHSSRGTTVLSCFRCDWPVKNTICGIRVNCARDLSIAYIYCAAFLQIFRVCCSLCTAFLQGCACDCRVVLHIARHSLNKCLA
jgi:hypothetical protein